MLWLTVLSVACVDWSPTDLDGDGVLAGQGDCNDLDPAVNGFADEIWYDGVDQDCDGNDDDQDQDGYPAVEAGGWDCWDDPRAIPDDYAIVTGQGFAQPSAIAVNPGATDVWYDGVDQDCNGDDDFDQDRDGFQAADHPQQDGTLGDDCVDTDPSVNPDGSELCNSIDDDCNTLVDDGTTCYDDDGDGWTEDDGDCDDDDATRYPGAPELCDELDNDCDPQVDEDVIDPVVVFNDTDGDGYGDPATQVETCAPGTDQVSDDTDCDDARADVYPGAPETCDDADQDCDTTVDEDATDASTWYADDDGDGYGDPADSTVACDAPAGTVADLTDCDPTDGAVYPGAPELCDGADQDCDTTIDEDPTDPSTWYADTDGDGYGDPASSVEACDAPSDHVADGSDCDPADAAVYPGATETCDDADQDCDTTIDEDASDATSWYDDSDGDGYGDPASVTVACEAPANTVASPGDCDPSDGSVHPGASETCDDSDQDCDTAVDEDATDTTAWYDDTDGDGYGDPASSVLACDAPTDHVADATDCDPSSADTYPGAPELCDGASNDCDASVDEDPVDPETWYLDSDGDGYGLTVATQESCDEPSGFTALPGDCDDAEGTVNPGALEVCGDGLDNDCADGDASCQLAGDQDLAGSVSVILGAANNDRLGQAVTGAGDVDGDGQDDLLVGSHKVGGGSGAAFVLLGPVSGTVDLATDADAELAGGSSESIAWSLQGGGDLDGDGTDDLVLGGYGADVGYVVAGPITAGMTLSSGATATISGAAGDRLGIDALVLADQDGDGNAEAVFGADAGDDDLTDGGSVYLFFGPVSGSLDDTAADAILTGETSGDRSGYSLSGGGDYNGDGTADLLIGSQFSDAGASTGGAAWVVLGPLTASASLADADARATGGTAGESVGYSVHGGPDVDGDGLDDVILGAPSYDGAAGSNQGAAYLGTTKFTGSVSVTSADAVILGDGAADELGVDADLVGDLDGDGYGDVVVGAYKVDGAATDSGAVYLFYGPLSGSLTAADADASWPGLGADRVGHGVGAAGDHTGDGLPDLLFGATQEDSGGTNAGAVYLVSGG